ncbi:MAG: nucleoside transporter C-terminal domain-containing protein [Planctomycetota bacterium]
MGIERFHGLLGIVLLIGVAWLLSEHRRKASIRLILGGVAMQFAVGLILLEVPGVNSAFEWLTNQFVVVLGFGGEGAKFVFGNLADPGGGAWGPVFFFIVTSVIVFFSSLMAIGYYLGITQRVIAALAFVLRRTLGMTGLEALAAAANVFVGQTEAPLVIKPYVPLLTRSQLFLVMVSGFATIAGSVFALIVSFAAGTDTAQQAELAKHLLTASLISAPGAYVIAKTMLPETEETPNELNLEIYQEDEQPGNLLDAAARGASEGMKLALNVAAMLIAFVALIALVNWPIGGIGQLFGRDDLSLGTILGWVFSPVAWAMGIESGDVLDISSTLGTSVVATELVAYERLGNLASPAEGEPIISERSRTIAAYALCGFANLPSVGIQVGGLSFMAPERRAEIAGLGIKAMFAGAMTCWMTACVASVIV